MESSGAQSDFDVLETVHGDRVQKRQLQTTHNASGIRCFLIFDTSFELAASSQVIRDCIRHEPICKPAFVLNCE